MSSEYYLDQVKKCVTFIFTEQSGQRRPIGTGFFASVKVDHESFAVYLVTAKHVLLDSRGGYVNSFTILMNTKQKTSELIVIDTSKNEILTHEDDNVDLAAILLYPPPEYFDYLSIPQDYFTDEKVLTDKNIREGARVFFAGLFSDFEGRHLNHPVVRFGNISLLGNEKIDISRKGEQQKLSHLYLVECQSLGGFSGSPVFFEKDRITKDKIFHSPEIYLGGVMKGHYRDIIEAHGIIRELNAALALVTPCYLLREIFDSDRAKKQLEGMARGKDPLS